MLLYYDVSISDQLLSFDTELQQQNRVSFSSYCKHVQVKKALLFLQYCFKFYLFHCQTKVHLNASQGH